MVHFEFLEVIGSIKAMLSKYMAIHYFDSEIKSGLGQKRKLSSFLKQKIHALLPVKKVNVNIIFCTDEDLLGKNQAFLAHDTLTDILTFDLSSSPDTLEAEIYISVERVRENAEKFSVPYTEELHRVIFHGILHLCGFGDQSKKEAALMRQQEQECLNQYAHYEN